MGYKHKIKKEVLIIKHIVLFSGGAGSSYVGWLVSKKYPKEDVVLLHTPTYSEHPDADRFREQVARFIGLPITVQADGRDVWQLIDDNHCLPSSFIPFCSRVLKQEQSDKYYKEISDDFIIYVGFDVSEWRRIQRQQARFMAMGYKSCYPLWDNKLTNEKVKDIIRNEWKICLPEPYKYLEHNNCVPCFKAGKSHFYKVWKYYPEYFNKAVEKEIKIGNTVFKDFSLSYLAKQWSKGLGQEEMFGEDEFVPCMCSL